MTKNNEILLINSNLIKPPIAPIGLDYIGGVLISNGFRVEILDLNFSKNIEKDIRTKLRSNSYLAIGLTIRNTDDCYFLSQDNFLTQIKNIITSIKKYTDSPLIVGGGGFSVMPVEIIKYLGVDYGIIGDGEFSFLKLIENIKNNKKHPDALNKIKGIIYKEKVNKPAKNDTNEKK